MIDIATYFGFFVAFLGSAGFLLFLKMTKEQRKTTRVKLLPLVVILVSAGIPFGSNSVANNTLKKLEKMEKIADYGKTFKGHEFSFAFSGELDIIRRMNDGAGKLIATLKLTPKTLGWEPEMVYVQASAIQAVQACYPKKWEVIKEDLFRIPMDKQKVRSRLRSQFKAEALRKSQNFCQFETLLKLI